MRDFQLSRYLKKWLPLIVIFFAAATGGTCLLLAALQEYTASAVIEYMNEGAELGYAPDDTEIDLSEINSSSNMAKVMDTLGLDEDIYNLDQLCASISVTAVEDEQREAIQAAMNEEGEEYTTKPTTYIVSCTLGAPADESTVRDILNETLDVYFEDYGNKHISQGEISNVTKKFTDSSYDYLEMVEEIDAALEDTADALDTRYSRNMEFRSTASGYSFADLSDRFSLLRNVTVYRLYAQILGNQLTKDKDVLIAKYQNRIANYELTGEKAQEDINEADRIIDAYVQKMRESNNTDLDYNYILEDVYGYAETDEEGNPQIVDRSVEYDTLLSNWVSYKNTLDNSAIDAAYCQFIIGIYQDGTGTELFSVLTDAETEAPVSESGTEAENAEAEAVPEEILNPESMEERLSRISVDQVTGEDVEKEISAVVEEMNRLYEITDITNQEYNEYLGAQSIEMRSSTSVDQRFNMKLFVALTAVCFLIIGCGGAVLLGRIGDIMEYLFLTDHQTGCMNRVSCDNFIRRHEKQILQNRFCCICLQIQNQRELNQLLGREAADKALEKTAGILKRIFGGRPESFIGYNGGGQFWVFYQAASGETSLSQNLSYLVSVMEDSFSEYSVAYSLGGANAEETKTYQIRSLISQAAVNKENHKTAAERTA